MTEASNDNVFDALDSALAARRDADPQTSYTASLYAGGAARIGAKIEEEAAEVIEAAGQPDDEHLVHEVADLWFHCMVLLQSRGLTTQQVQHELARRFGVSGHAEKAARAGNDDAHRD